MPDPFLPREHYHKQYKAIMQSIQDFFDGKTDWVKKSLLSEIQDCIVHERFERAAKLRDIYNHIDQFTQKQTVILDHSLHGVVAQILCIESKRVYVVMVFQDGKMVDVLRFSESIDDLDQDQIITSIELEFWPLARKQISKNSNTSYVFSKWLRISAKLRKELDQHFSNFVTSFIASSSWEKDSLANDILKGLQERYELSHYPYRIEALDISHLSGGRASGGLSCMVGTMTEKRGYRRYKIKRATWWDDYDSLKECIVRRFKDAYVQSTKVDNKKESKASFLPDLFIIDGGAQQLDVLVRLFKQWLIDPALLDTIQFASLGKGVARQSRNKIYGEKEILYILKITKEHWVLASNDKNDIDFSVYQKEVVYDEVDKTLIRVRDEAHRFANSYRKKQMSMEIKHKSP